MSLPSRALCVACWVVVTRDFRAMLRLCEADAATRTWLLQDTVHSRTSIVVR